MNRTFTFLSLLFAMLALSPSMAHLLEMYQKLQMPQQDYAVVQQIYRGWALLGAFQVCFLVAVFIKLLHEKGAAFRLTLGALVCSAAMLLLFFFFTFPVNRATANWTQLPENWAALRLQWEYSHAIVAILGLIAFILLLLSLLERPRPTRSIS
ncbi:DUF1772 domain-containing protein [Chitinophaga agrisoli]|uniref:DUF1772 domain-containing protein n=1 Tax=Chitinophaga agrisoli TaxID=2607653 RepID=A0A5B2VIR7_9BACT|nr:DUF1772 domain-containing protein [Chitinophaga agrisoli]KAA2238446.1 DUF1772 domain-containing protein [Chitinophaga agrisoli]